MALWTYAFVLIHYGLEFFVYRSVKPNAGFLSPAIIGGRCTTLQGVTEFVLNTTIAGTSLVWMLQQYNFYT
jgi:hypothetical protein